MKSTLQANAILDHEHGGPDYTRPASTWFQPMTAAPSTGGGGTAAPGLAAIEVDNDDDHWAAASGGQKQNLEVMDFGNSAGASGIVVGIAEYSDADLADAHLMNYGALTTPRDVPDATPFQVPVGGAIFSITA